MNQTYNPAMRDDGARKKGLGRGLAALLGDDARDFADLDRDHAARTVPIENLRPNRFQPRRHWDAEELQALAQSVGARGVLQPILVRPVPDQTGIYEIIAGERRWRAAQLARLHEVPVVIKDVSDGDSLELALIENVQRQDLAPLEEAAGYQRLIDEFRYTQGQLAAAVGKSRPHIANLLRLLGLPEPVKAMLDDGRLSAGAARALLTADDPVALANDIVRRGLNVRDVERRRRAPTAEKDADTRALEGSLTAALGLKVTVHHRGEKGGEVRIHYRSLEQLDEICRRLSRQTDAGDDMGEDPFDDRPASDRLAPAPAADLANLGEPEPAVEPEGRSGRSPVELMEGAIYRGEVDAADDEPPAPGQ